MFVRRACDKLSMAEGTAEFGMAIVSAFAPIDEKTNIIRRLGLRLCDEIAILVVRLQNTQQAGEIIFTKYKV